MLYSIKADRKTEIIRGCFMNIDYKLIGERIKRRRKSRGMTQELLAERLNVSIGYVSQVERGITKISLELLGAISSILECDIAELISESVPSQNKYMDTEFTEAFNRLDDRRRKYILTVMELTKELS